jgi:hypothetical protein
MEARFNRPKTKMKQTEITFISNALRYSKERCSVPGFCASTARPSGKSSIKMKMKWSFDGNK